MNLISLQTKCCPEILSLLSSHFSLIRFSSAKYPAIMCNLLLPLCPFVLHSVDTSTRNGPKYGRNPSDVQILYSYLSKRPYFSRTSRSREHPSQIQTVPLARETTKLYKRTNWHTCLCEFDHVGVLHPMPGPTRLTFGMSYKPCKRCSQAAKILKPVRKGGIAEKGDPY